MVPEVLRENRSQNGSSRLGRPLLCGAVILLLGACGAPQPKPVDRGAEPIDPSILVEYSKLLRDYIQALLLLDSPNSRDWVDAKRKLEALNFAYFKEDRFYFQQFCEGDAVVSENARKELVRRGKMLQYSLVFIQPYAPATWEHARKEMMALGDGAPEFLTISLLKILLNGRFRSVWPHLREHLVAVGKVALETTIVLTRDLADKTPETPIYRSEDLGQLIMVLIAFGEEARPVMEELAKHRVFNVRRSVARAIGDSLDVEGADILVGYLQKDNEWVRLTAASAMGQLKPARKKLGPVLEERLRVEKDVLVRHEILRALGRIGYLPAIPVLMNTLDVPNYDTVQIAMQALYDLTGERLTTAGQWKRWYSDRYPAWIKERGQ